MSPSNRIHPGRIWYFMACIILVLGMGTFALLTLYSIKTATQSNTQMLAPGKLELKFTQPGHFTIYYESESVFQGRVYRTGEYLPGLSVLIYDKDSGQKIPVFSPQATESYELGGRKGKSVFQFKIEKPGTYILQAFYPGDEDSPKVILAVGKGFALKMTLLIITSVGLLFLSFILFISIFVVTYIKRDRVLRKLKAEKASSP